jgi:DNA-binding transcriptional LysR family regulator
LIYAFRERFPTVEVSILQQNNFKSIEAVQQRADLGIGYLAAESTSPVGALKSWTIATAPIGVAVAATVEHNHRGGGPASRFCPRALSHFRSEVCSGLRRVEPLNFSRDGFRTGEDDISGQR